VPYHLKKSLIFQKKTEFLQEFIKTEEVDEKEHISDETPYIELAKSER
jgi:hypothetical protein